MGIPVSRPDMHEVIFSEHRRRFMYRRCLAARLAAGDTTAFATGGFTTTKTNVITVGGHLGNWLLLAAW